MNEKKDRHEEKTENIDLEALLREKEKLESLIKRKFSKKITVMFTDLTGSTQLSDELGDIAMRSLLKQHYDIIFPIVEASNGTLVKTMGDGTLSYFLEPADAIRAAIGIQRGFDKYNQDKNHIPLLIRCGLNTGNGIVEKKDIYGDVVNVAQRFEAIARPREILLSQDTFDLVCNEEDLCIAFSQETHIKGKFGLQKIYKALWAEDEIEKFRELPPEARVAPTAPGGAVTADLPVEWHGAPPTTEVVTMNVQADAKLFVEQKGKAPVSYDVGLDEMIVGRSANADIHLADAFVSRRHAKIYRKDGRYFIEDLGSHIGTTHDGKKISTYEMRDGDEFHIGSVKLVFRSKKEKGKAPDSDVWTDGAATMAFEKGQILSLVVEEGGEIIAHFGLSESPIVIGRIRDSDIRLESPMVSRRHARIFKQDDKAVVEDLDSNNGTFINGKRVKSAMVEVGGEIRIGPFSLKVVDPTRPLSEHDANASIVTKLFSFLSKK